MESERLNLINLQSHQTNTMIYRQLYNWIYFKEDNSNSQYCTHCAYLNKGQRTVTVIAQQKCSQIKNAVL